MKDITKLESKESSLEFIDEHKRLTSLASDIIDEAKKKGASQCEVGIILGKGLTVSVRLQELETVEFHKDINFGITVYREKKKGSSTTTDNSWSAICDAINAANDIAEYASEDPNAGLAEKNMMATSCPDLDLYHPWNISVNDATELALRSEYAGRSFDKRISNSEGSSVSTYIEGKVYGNSQGFVGSVLSSHQSISCSLLAKQAEEMQVDNWYTLSRNKDNLKTPEEVGKKAAKRVLNKLNSRKIPTKKVPIIFSSLVSSGLIGCLGSAISGHAQYKKSSFLLDYLHKKIFPSWVNIKEEPLIKTALGSSAFDGDGLATYDKFFIEQGELVNYILTTYSARKLKMKSTANAGGTSNIILEGNMSGEKELIKNLDTGLLVTDLTGQGINMVTGDYSRGINGFWIEQGKIQFPVSEVTIAGNLKDMFQNIVAAGTDYDERKSTRVGSLLIDGMTIAGN